MEQNEGTRSTEVRQAEVRFRRNNAGSSRYRSFILGSLQNLGRQRIQRKKILQSGVCLVWDSLTPEVHRHSLLSSVCHVKLVLTSVPILKIDYSQNCPKKSLRDHVQSCTSCTSKYIMYLEIMYNHKKFGAACFFFQQ